MADILFTGSRGYKFNSDNLQKVAAIVRQHVGLQDRIIVGDADGIDAMVVKAAQDMEVDYLVHGVGKCRLKNVPADKVILTSKIYFHGAYPARDRYMVDHYDLHKVVALWDGESSGTKYTYDYAKKRKTPIEFYLYNPDLTDYREYGMNIIEKQLGWWK